MIKIEQLLNVTTKALEDLAKLLPQVSSSPHQLSYASLLEFIKDPGVTLLVVKEAGDIIGMGTLVMFHTISGKRGKLEHIVIDEAHRGQGLGEKLTKKLIDLAREEKVGQVELTSRAERVAAHKLYQKLGFVKKETDVFRLKL